MLWAGQQLQPEAPLYNMAFVFDFSEAIEEEAFTWAFQLLLQKSDALRTIFIIEDGVPKQQVLADFDYKLGILDWSERPDLIENAKAWGAARSRNLFDLSQCLFEAILIKAGTNRYFFYLNQHHLITDAWAVTVLMKTLSDLYQKALKEELHLANGIPSFRDFVEYEQTSQNNARNEKARQYWKEKAQQLPPAPNLYSAKNPREVSRAKRVLVPLGKERSVALKQLAQEKDLRSWTIHASLFNIFVTTLSIYLHRVSGQKKIAVGTPAHNRVKPKFKNTIGVFIELFPLLTEIEEGDSFLEVFKKVQKESNQFLRYAQPGFSSTSLSKSFNAVLNYIHASMSNFADIPMQSEWVHQGHCDPNHHIRMQVYDFDDTGEISIYFDLNEAVFDEYTRQNAPYHFLQILDDFIEDRTQVIDSHSLLMKSEYDDLIINFNHNPSIEKKESVLDLFQRQALIRPKAIAIAANDLNIDYKTLDQKSNQLAHYLLQKGIQKGDRIALYLKRSPELVQAILATWKIGATYIPIASDTPSNRVLKTIDLADAKLSLTHQNLLEKLPKNSYTIRAFEQIQDEVDRFPVTNINIKKNPKELAYIMFTSGSTGEPKGVMIAQEALSNYLQAAKEKYLGEEQWNFPLFSRIGFDLTVTSLFLPLISGGKMIIYEESDAGPDLAILKVIEENRVDFIKLTPSHLSLLHDKNLKESRIKTMIVGGENFSMNLALQIQSIFPDALKIYNEYGPTEATVGCVVHQLNVTKDRAKNAVPIGVPVAGMQAYVLDRQLNPVPRGVIGELYISGIALAEGYWKKEDLTSERFLPNPFLTGTKMYQTGDLAKMNATGQLEYLGRSDEQVKIGGIRVELGEIEAALQTHPSLQNVVVDLWDKTPAPASDTLHYCNSCGLPSNYPNVEFDDEGICNFCHSFEAFEQKAQQYFKNIDDLKAIFTQAQTRKTGKYDCMMLLSGGKDSTYALGQLVELGYNVLAFTLDNGYISQQALDNVQRVAKEIGVDCVVGETPAMNEIFVDSLHRHCNVCNGCFKTIYTLSTQIAVEKGIPIIVTGLSRGQFFETRLTEELFWKDEVDVAAIDQIILNARKEYHQVDDAVKRLMDVSIFENGKVFEQVEYVDFYRYTDVTLNEMYEYLDRRLPWVRPTDTGRSTNCLINKLGIHVHTKEQGYSNYAFPYSWDVRMGHKERDMAIDEINEPIDIEEVTQMMREIGYVPPSEQDRKELLAFYSAPTHLAEADLKQYLAKYLPTYMIPTRFQRVETFPLSPNGKIDRKALRDIREIAVKTDVVYVAPSTEFEEIVADIWATVLELEQVGIHDDFLALGGNSLEAIRVMARTNEALELDLPISLIFQKPTIEEFAAEVERVIVELLAEV